ncbi:MAG: S1C family serine protease, partial [Planctomycetota bacterium]
MKSVFLLSFLFFYHCLFAQSLKAFEEENIALIQKLKQQVVSIISCQNSKESKLEAQYLRTSFSGVIFDHKGHILTIGEAIRGAEVIYVELVNREVFQASVLGLDDFSNIGILKIDVKEEVLFPVEWGNSDQLQLGSFLFTLGNPYDFSHSLDLGNVSGLERFISPYLPDMIQMTNNINPGDPGGLVANSSGQFVGMMFTTLGPPQNSMQTVKDDFNQIFNLLNSFEGKSSAEIVQQMNQFFQKSIQKKKDISPLFGAQGINFFLPSNRIHFVVSEIIGCGRVRRGKLGVSIVPLTLEVRKEQKLTHGVKVEKVADQGPAFQAGIRENDILLSCNQILIRNPAQIRNIIQE